MRYQREMLRRLDRIEALLEVAVERLAERDEAKRPEEHERVEFAADKWMQEGIDQILSYQPGKKRHKEDER